MKINVFHITSLLMGILLAVMVTLNGKLSNQYGIYSATVIMHVIGFISILVILLVKREKPFIKLHNWFLYLGGAIGVITIVFNNLAFGRISVSAILALGLLGQIVTGLLIDQFGFINMPKHSFKKQKSIGLLLIIIGIVIMISNFEILAVLISFITGINIVITRILNAKLAEKTSVKTSTFFNYLVGFIIAIFLLLIFGKNEMILTNTMFSNKYYIYLGGVIGVVIVLLSNITVSNISEYYLSLFLFIGQVFTGILIDILISGSFSLRNLLGGTLVAAGLIINFFIDKKLKEKYL